MQSTCDVASLYYEFGAMSFFFIFTFLFFFLKKKLMSRKYQKVSTRGVRDSVSAIFFPNLSLN